MSLPTRKKKISIVGFPVHKGQHLAGVELGPRILRDGGLLERLQMLGLDVEDQGDITLPDFENDFHPDLNLKSPIHISAGSKIISNVVCRTIESGNLCVALGGDRSVVIGTINGHAKARDNPIVIWIDAHADLKMPSEVRTGNIHAMALSFLVKEFKPFLPDIPGFEDFEPCISAKDLVFIGLREITPGERKVIEDLGILAYTVHDIDKIGIAHVLEEALRTLDPGFDADGLDPTITPCTGFPVPGGLTFREALFIAEEVASTGRLSCIDITELNPLLGNEKDVETSVNTVLTILQNALGHRRQVRRSK